jgi:hypothetical protein
MLALSGVRTMYSCGYVLTTADCEGARGNALHS